MSDTTGSTSGPTSESTPSTAPTGADGAPGGPAAGWLACARPDPIQAWDDAARSCREPDS